MEWERMRHEWQSRSAETRETGLALPADAARLWRKIRLRDWMETLVAIPMMLILGIVAWPLWIAGFALSALSAALLAAAGPLVALRLGRARRLFPAQESDLPLLAFLRRARGALVHQRRMLASVLWWYIGPLLLGAFGLFFGIRGLHWHSLAYLVVVLLVGFGVERLNRFAVRNQIEPAITALDEQIRRLEEDDAD